MDDEDARRRTATLEEARDHARSQDGAASADHRTIPASDATNLPAGVVPEDVCWDETIGVGGYTSRQLPRGTVLRVDDLDGDACVQLLVYNAARTSERLNVADTVKVQWQAYLGEGSMLLSDMGRVLLTIVEDTSRGHDCLCGGSNRRTNQERYGDGSVSGPAPNARDLLALGGLKQGLGRVDIAPPVNLFRRVTVGADGTLSLEPTGGPGHVVLLAELDVIVLVANTPHPLDERDDYAGGPVRLLAWDRHRAGEELSAASIPEPSTPERRRARRNTEDHLRELVR